MFGPQMDRRAFLRRGGAGLSVLTLPGLIAACGGGSSSGGGSGGPSKELTVVSYGGDYQKAQDEAYWKPFLKANAGATIRQDSPSDNAKIKAMAESGNVSWDLALVDDSFGLDTDGEWLEPIDYSVLDKSAFLPGYAMKYRVGADVEATVLAYREDKLDTPPSGLADFFDPQKVPGKRAAWKYAAGGILEAALIADGVAPDKLYPLDVDRALKKLDAIRDDLVWWTEGAQSQQLLASGETPMALVWTGRAVDAAESGAAVKVQWAQWLSQNGWWVIPKGAPNKDFAMQVLKYQTSPEAQARLTKLLPYGPTNKGALDKVDAKYKDQLPTSHLDSKVTLDPAWWGPNYDAVDKKFQAWLLG